MDLRRAVILVMGFQGENLCILY